LAGRVAPAKFGTHSLREATTVLFYRHSGDLRALQLLLGNSEIESKVRCLGKNIELAERSRSDGGATRAIPDNVGGALRAIDYSLVA
jgi:hypothetical protein